MKIFFFVSELGLINIFSVVMTLSEWSAETSSRNVVLSALSLQISEDNKLLVTSQKPLNAWS